MRYEPHVVECDDCEWSQPMPNRETADHQKRVHENEYPEHAAYVEKLPDDEVERRGESDE